MSGATSPQRGLTRRSFLKTTAVAAGAVAAAGAVSPLTALAESDQPESSEVQTYMCECVGGCLGHCTHMVHVKDGKAFNITKHPLPDPAWESICQRGFTQLQRVYDPNRVKYPMRRVEGTPRGGGEWERISWDEAFTEITAKWKEYQAEFGNESIAFFTDAGNVRSDLTGYCPRLQEYLGATYIRNSFDGNGNFNMPRILGYGLWLRGNDWRSVRDSKNIVVWAHNPTDSISIRCRWIFDAQQSGAKLAVIDPTYTTIASKANEFYPIRPGSDGYLALAIVNDIISNGLQDEEKLKTKTVGPFLVKETDGTFLRLSDLGRAEAGSTDDAIVVRTASGEYVPASEESDPVLYGTFDANGISVTTAFDLLAERASEYTYEQAEEYCDLTMDQILGIADLFKSGPTTVISSYGIDKYANAGTFYTSMFALLMVSGNIAKPGAGYIDGYCSMPLGLAGGNSGNIPGPAPQGSSLFWDTHMYEVVVEGKPYGGVKRPPIKSLYIYSSNMLRVQPCRRKWLEIFDAIELIVCADVRMSETAKYSDIVLPVPHYYELESFDTNNAYCRINEAAVPPAFESMGDLEIMNELGCRMGYEESFSMTREEYNQNAFKDATSEALGISWESLKKEKAQFAFAPGVYVQGESGDYVTSTGRAQFFIEGVRPIPDLPIEGWDWHKEALPYWEPPREAWYENPLHEKYPLSFYQKHGKFKVHTQYTDIPTLLEIENEPILYISEPDAEERGLQTGDTVRAFNDRGYMVCKVEIHPGMRPGTSCMAHGWEEDQFIEGHLQDLTPLFYSNYIAAPCFFDTLIQVEKYEGGAN